MAVRVAVVGTGYLGAHHMRVLSEIPAAELVGFVELDDARAAELAARFSVPRLESLDEVARVARAAVVAAPTVAHYDIAAHLLDAGVDLMVEKPFTTTLAQARELCALAERGGRVLQVGHIERFNPAVTAVIDSLHGARFVEAHRLGSFSARSLDVDVVLDLMIHDLQILLDVVGEEPREVRAVGIPVLTERVDIANARLEFPGGAIANLTASRVSAEKIRKFRVFQPRAYYSIDYAAQEVQAYRLAGAGLVQAAASGPAGAIEKVEVEVARAEPLRLELEHFLGCVASRERPLVSGEAGMRALALALDITAQIGSTSLGGE